MESFQLKTHDGLTLNASCWSTDQNPLAAILIIHGLGEHHHRYHHVAQYYTKKNIQVYSMDLRGHGKSEGKIGFSPSESALQQDIESLLIKVREDFNDLPIILYGHSMGGNLALNYLLHNPGKEISAAIITSPWIKLTKAPTAIEVAMAGFVQKIFPSFHKSNGLDVNQLSRDKQVVADYQEDPLVHNQISVGLFHICHNNGINALEDASLLSTPTLLMHGTEDGITSPKASEEFAKKAGDIVHLKLWDGYRHETHNELNYESVLDYQYQWLVSMVNLESPDLKTP